MTSYWQDPNLKLYFNSSADLATGYLNGVPDGDYGPKTKRAVIRF